uniref:Protein TIC 214 n=2 Tax=Idiospermum australiense TaxID=13573 RepID=A0A4Y5RC57_IDIAU|nr:hypothetical chloroplast RF19 [Idiospermum australiense]QCY72556.1 hypothetical chloroplast RF19 [Idiospermum australiense]
MIFKSFLLGNLLSLCMKIINSVVVVGLYYGFLTTFSIGPSYLFLLRARVMEEGTEKKVSATTGFITGQLMIFISIYYAPLHLAMGRPYTITVLVLPYLLFHFFWKNHKHFTFDYRSTTLNSIRNFSIQSIFWNNLIFQLCNHFVLPSSTLIRLVNIYMFRCNNKMLFVTSSFVGWLIGHILFMKWVGLILFWIQRNRSIRSNLLIRSNKYLVSELIHFLSRMLNIFLFITCVYYLGRMPSPILTQKLKETEEKEENEDETSEEREDPNKLREKKRRGYQENWKLEILKDKDLFWFEKPIVTLLFDYKRWDRPLRYIKNDRFANAVRNEMSQYFFHKCPVDGKQKISFTYPPSLSIFFEMIEKHLSLCTTEKLSPEDLYNHWVSTNEKKRCNLNNEFINRIEALNKGSLSMHVLEKRTRLCNDKNEQECLPRMYDPFLNGPYRGTIKKVYSHQILDDSTTSTEDSIRVVWTNKIHDIFPTNYREFEDKIDRFNGESLSTDISHSLTFTSELAGESPIHFRFNLKEGLVLPTEQKQRRFDSENQMKCLKFLFDAITNDTPNYQTIHKKSIGIEEIGKKVPRWSYKLTNDLQQQEEENEEESMEGHGVRSRKSKRVVIYTDNDKDPNTPISTNSNQGEEVALIRYSQQSDFCRDLIKGSRRAQRRKTVTWEMFQANVHSPLFLDRIDKTSFFSFSISETINLAFRNWMEKGSEFKTSNSEEKKTKEKDKKEENERIAIAETWDTIIFAQAIRGIMLVTQSTLRKYIILPSLIIAKNLVRMLLFQFPEWYEDLKEWNREMHVKCTYNGVQLSETEFPKDWLTDGIQIKILFPFCLKPWHRSKLRSHHRDPMKNKEKKANFCFLTVWGMETELPFGSPRKRPSFLEPILKELEKKIRKAKKKCFLVLSVLKERTKWFLKVSKEKTRWIRQIVLFVKKIIKEFAKVNSIFLFGFKKVYESNENEEDSITIISNKIVSESTIRIRSMDWTNYSLTETKMKDLSDRTTIIRNKIERITKEKIKIFLTPDINSSPNETSCDDKRSESQKHIWQISKRRSARFIRKWRYFLKFFSERIYIDIFLCSINIARVNAQLFLESTKKMIDKYIYNDQRNKEGIDETNQNTIISTSKKYFSNISNKKSQIYWDLSSLSQAYLFYKLSQTQVSNKYRLKSVLQYHDLFLRDRIRDYLRTRGIFDSKLRHNKLPNSGMDEWKNWLRGHYQYNLPQTRWSRFGSQKWRDRVNQHRTIQNKDSKKDSYEKDQFIHYEKQHDSVVNSLPSQKEKFQKHYRYDLFSYKYIHYGDSKGSYRLPLQINEDRGIPYNYKTPKSESVFVLGGIALSDYLEEKYIIDRGKSRESRDRKYLDWKNLHFCLRKNIDIEAWTNIHKNTKTGTDDYQISAEKDPFYLTTYQEINPLNPKSFFLSRMGMNQGMLYRPISNLAPWFFSEFVPLYDAYKIKPWIIPIKLLLFNLNGNENISENKNINGNQKDYLELENGNQEEKDFLGQGNLGSDARNQQKDVERDYAESDIKKLGNKRQFKSNKGAELQFFLKRYLLFQLRWDDPLNQRIMNNVKVYCLLLRLINPREIAISSIQRGEMRLDVMLIQKDLTLTELIKRGIFIIEPVRLSIKWDGQFIMYQTIGVSLVHKNKHQTNRRYREKRSVDDNFFDGSIAQHGKMLVNGDENDYDLLVPENILSPRRRRELRIIISFNSGNRNLVDRNLVFFNGNNVKNCGQFLDEDKHIDTDINKFIQFKLFLWPNYRLEDLACMNRYWFDTNNGSRFSMLRIHMYPPRFGIS